MPFSRLLDCSPAAYNVRSKAPGPDGELPLTPEMLLDSPSGDIFGMTQNAGMGWDPNQLLRDQYLFAVLYYKKLVVRLDLAELSAVRISLK